MKCRRIDRLCARIDNGGRDDVVQDNDAVTSVPAERDAQWHRLVPVYLALYLSTCPTWLSISLPVLPGSLFLYLSYLALYLSTCPTCLHTSLHQPSTAATTTATRDSLVS